MDKDTAHKFALAIAKANGHPNPDDWAATVAAYFAGEAPELPALMTPEEVAAAQPPEDVATANVESVPAGAGLTEPEAPAA